MLSGRNSHRHDEVLRRFQLGFDGPALPAELADLLARGLAGVVIYPRNYRDAEGLRALAADIRRAAARPVLIGIDQEGGTRFALKEPFTIWPSPAELGHIGDANLVERVARAIALELRAAGCNLDFAPMLDLHINPESPVTKDRSFGSDPHGVAQMGAAFIRGLRAGNVLACAKHYPGHGDAAVDPHLDLPVFGGAASRLDSFELVPFAAAARENVPLIMTAHILLPQIDPERPASLSRRMLSDVLRGRMGFSGIILADDLGMGAIAKLYGSGEAAIATFLAGTDIAMLCHDWSAVAPAIEAVKQAREAGRFAESEWTASLDRIEAVCAAATAAYSPQPPIEVIGCAEHRELAEEIRARLK